MLPEEKARVKIDKQLSDAGWDIVARNEYVPLNASAVKEEWAGQRLLKMAQRRYIEYR